MMLKKKISAFLVCMAFLISAFTVTSIAEEINESESVITPSETFELKLSPDNFATVMLSSPSSNYKTNKVLCATVNQYYGNKELNARWATVVTSYDVPLRYALSNVKVTFYMMPGNDQDSRHVPIWFDLNPLPDTVEKTAGKYVDQSVEENEESNAKYTAWTDYIKNGYWNKTEDTSSWTLCYKVSNISGEKLHSFDVTDTALSALKESSTPYITFATGTASNYYYNYRLKTRSGYPYNLTLTYNTSDVLSYVNSANSENIADVIKDIGRVGLLSDTSYTYDDYTNYTASAKKEVEKKMLLKIAESSFTTVDELKSAFEEAMVLNTLTSVISPENYALVVATDDCGYYSDQGSGYNKLALKAYVNTLYPSSTELHSQMVSLLSDYKINFRKAVTGVKTKYFVTKADQSGVIPVYYQNKALSDMTDVETGVFLKDDADTGEVYSKWLSLVGNYWSTGHEVTTAWPCAYKISSPSSNGVNEYDISSGVVDSIRISETDSLTLATGRVTNYYNNMRIRTNSQNYIPTLTVLYIESDILEELNDTDENEISTLIQKLVESNLLGDSGEAYLTLEESYKSVAHSAVYDVIENGGYTSFDEFLAVFKKSINLATEAIKDNPLIYVNFDDKLPQSAVGNPAVNVSFDGSNSLKIRNEYQKTATQYINLGNADLSSTDFTVMFWMKAENRGLNGVGKTISSGTAIDFSDTTATNGGVVFSNRDYSTPENKGLTMLALPRSADFAINAKIGDNDGINIDTVWEPVDSRWHQVAYSVDREGNAILYVDDTVKSTVDISGFSGDFGSKESNLIFGADSLGQYGMNKGEFDEIRVYEKAMSESEIKQMYYENSLKKINEDISSLLKSDDCVKYPESDLDTLKKMHIASENYLDSYEWGNTEELKKNLDDINIYFDDFLEKRAANGITLYVSDVHINNATDGVFPNGNFIKAMTEFKDEGLDLKTLLLSGDNTESGSWYQDDFFDKFLDAYWMNENLNTVVARGNHDYPVYEGSYRYDEEGNKFTPTEAFLRNEFIKRINPYVDVTLYENKSLLDDEGALTTPYYYQTDGIAHYIVLDNYTPALHIMDDKQLNWLDNTLKSISGDGKPIFVVQHQQILGTMEHSDSRFDLNDDTTNKLDAILKKYNEDNIFVLCGHFHVGFGTATAGPVSVDDSYYILSGPSLEKKQNIGYQNASGYYIFISDDEVTFRARDFESQSWVRDYDFTLPLKPATKTSLLRIELTNEDGNIKYDSLASALGKKTVINVPSYIEEKECVAVMAIYENNKLLYVDYKTITQSEAISFSASIPANTTEIKVMLIDDYDKISPLCKSIKIAE